MIKLEDYIYQYDALNSSDFMLEDPINEGKIISSIKKIWNYLTGKKRKKKNNDSAGYHKYYTNNDEYIKFDNDDNKSVIDNITFKTIKYSEIRDIILSKRINIDKNFDENKITTMVAELDKNIVGIFVFTLLKYLKFNDLDEKYNSSIYIYVLHIDDIFNKYQYHISQKFIDYLYKYIDNIYSREKLLPQNIYLTISEKNKDNFNCNDMFNNQNVIELKNKKLLYINHEDIKKYFKSKIE